MTKSIGEKQVAVKTLDLDPASNQGIIPKDTIVSNEYSASVQPSQSAQPTIALLASGQSQQEVSSCRPSVDESSAGFLAQPTQDGQPFSYDGEFDDFGMFMESIGWQEFDHQLASNPAQPALSFPPDPIFPLLGESPGQGSLRSPTADTFEEISSFTQFGKRLPSLRLDQDANPELPGQPRELWDVTEGDRQHLNVQLRNFSTVIPSDFVLPSRIALSRYLFRYARGFHEHLPFLHIPTLRIGAASLELVIAIAAAGANYCFEESRAVQLYRTAKAVALERIRQQKESYGVRVSVDQDQGLRARSAPSASRNGTALHTIQALFILMVMATWGDPKLIYKEDMELGSILSSLIREEQLVDWRSSTEPSWEAWIRYEGAKRTLFTVFCFFVFHTIVYNTPPAMLNGELKMNLPCQEVHWRCPTAAVWSEARCSDGTEVLFQDAFSRLFSDGRDDATNAVSSFSNYILILALIQHIFLVRQLSKGKPGTENLPQAEISTLERALRNWQDGWERNPESSLDPQDPSGPLAFTSTALLRIAYVRLSIDIGPWRSLETKDPERIARAMFRSPIIQRSRRLTRAALHSAHALSIPVKLGLDLVARSQTLTWSLQHSVCSLECAFVLSKWLEAVTMKPLGTPLDADEERLLAFIINMLAEADSTDLPNQIEGLDRTATKMNARVVKIWAKLFRGERVWDVVDQIGRALAIYGEMLDGTFEESNNSVVVVDIL